MPPHAKLKWTQRGDQRLGLYQAWTQSVGIGLTDDCPYGPKARLHAPSDSLLIYTDAKEDGTKFVIKTVLNASWVEEEFGLNDDHLVRCDECDLRHEGGIDCPWCE